MASVICAADRALIDAHLARYGVTRVAMGVSGLDPDAPPRTWASAYAKRREGMAYRRTKVLALVQKGRTQAEIAAAVGVSVSTVVADIRALKEDGRLLPDDRRIGGKNG